MGNSKKIIKIEYPIRIGGYSGCHPQDDGSFVKVFQTYQEACDFVEANYRKNGYPSLRVCQIVTEV